jgi:leader peptidase (prepilin peptidase)/N-methyltransferase
MNERALLGLLALAGGALLGAATGMALDLLYRDGPRTPLLLRRPRTRILLLALSTAIVWFLAAVRADGLRVFVLTTVFASVLLALSATDFERHLLPNRLMYPSLLAGLLLAAAWPARPTLASISGGTIATAWPGWLSGATGALASGIAGAIVGGTIMLVIFILFPGFGFGDVKLGTLIGFVVGFPAVVTALLLGMFIGGVAAGAMLLARRVRLGSAIAYGPYLAAGAILVMLWRR